jgi:Alpha/beta hydrolase family
VRLCSSPTPGRPSAPRPILPPTGGFLFLDRDKFHDSFAADVPAGQAAFMADSQVPWGVDALGGTITEPAWRAKPSWYLLTTEDKMIPPPAQRDMSGRAGATVTEAAASHSVYVSQPAAVAAIIKQAASGVAARAVTTASLATAQATARHPTAATEFRVAAVVKALMLRSLGADRIVGLVERQVP